MLSRSRGGVEMLGFLLFFLRPRSGAEGVSDGGAGMGTVEGRGGTSIGGGGGCNSGADALRGVIGGRVTEDETEEVCWGTGAGTSFLGCETARALEELANVLRCASGGECFSGNGGAVSGDLLGSRGK